MNWLVDAAHDVYDHLAAVGWKYVALGLACHFLKTVAVSRAWRNTIVASYPDARVRWRHVYGAYIAGVGVNAIIPARAGDLVKLYIAKHRIADSTYTTLASTIAALTVFDFAAAGALLLWALAIGVLPSLDVLPHLRTFDFRWLFAHPRLAAALAGALAIVLALVGTWAWRRVAAFKRRVALGFAVFRDRGAYVRHVAAWQALDWSLRIATIFFFLRAFGVTATIHNALLVQVTESLSTVFPFSPSGLGTEQALTVYVLQGAAKTSTIVTFSLSMKAAVVAFNVAAGLVATALLLGTVRWRRVIETARRRRLAEGTPPA
jgi:uncharacterized membrane protein YbhN (UPF0104 family)